MTHRVPNGPFSDLYHSGPTFNRVFLLLYNMRFPQLLLTRSTANALSHDLSASVNVDTQGATLLSEWVPPLFCRPSIVENWGFSRRAQKGGEGMGYSLRVQRRTNMHERSSYVSGAKRHYSMSTQRS